MCHVFYSFDPNSNSLAIRSVFDQMRSPLDMIKGIRSGSDSVNMR